MSTSADDLGGELQAHCTTELPDLMECAVKLIQTRPAWTPQLKNVVCRAIAQRIFLLLNDARVSFTTNAKTGYFTTAVLTRSIMENGSVLCFLTRDDTNETLSAFIASAEMESRRRRDGIARLSSSTASAVAQAAGTEAVIADSIYQQLCSLRGVAKLPVSRRTLPSMAERCRELGEFWRFHYEATYRDLSAAVHGGFLKTTHAPSIATKSPNPGGAVLYEHCVAITHAVEFWAVSILECGLHHPDKNAERDFHIRTERFLLRAADLLDKLGGLGLQHSFNL
jgi:hypothetical protein